MQKARVRAQKRSIANMPAKTRTALGKQGAAVAQRKRTGGSSPKTARLVGGRPGGESQD